MNNLVSDFKFFWEAFVTLVVTPRSDADVQSHAFAKMVQKLTRTISDVRDGAAAVTSAAQQVSASAQALSQGTNAQASSVEETTASLEELNASIAEISTASLVRTNSRTFSSAVFPRPAHGAQDRR